MVSSVQATSKNSFSFGIEEEYFLADTETFEAPSDTPAALFDKLDQNTGGRAGRESLQAQMEVSTMPARSATAAKEELCRLRQASAGAARSHGLAILACGTHPTACWRHISPSSSERYLKVMDSLRMIGRRNMLCGMHVHVELPDPHRRVDVMTRMIPYLPLFIALSASSPFWEGHETGLLSYRSAAYDELPRSGFPGIFFSEEEYGRYVTALVQAGAIEDPSYIWWMVRTSSKYPTLELRAPDVCTRLDDAIAIACLYQGLVSYLFRTPGKFRDLSAADGAIAAENKWRAQRYGIQGTFAARDGPKSCAQFLDEVIDMIADDAGSLGCSEQILHCRNIILGGTSADVQLKVFEERKHEGQEAALREAAAWIAPLPPYSLAAIFRPCTGGDGHGSRPRQLPPLRLRRMDVHA
ncbi:MAG: carboxylate-amine ligase [Rhodomicrobium sp.]